MKGVGAQVGSGVPRCERDHQEFSARMSSGTATWLKVPTHVAFTVSIGGRAANRSSPDVHPSFPRRVDRLICASCAPDNSSAHAMLNHVRVSFRRYDRKEQVGLPGGARV
jgi:hypothetical protein